MLEFVHNDSWKAEDDYIMMHYNIQGLNVFYIQEVVYFSPKPLSNKNNNSYPAIFSQDKSNIYAKNLKVEVEL